MAVVVVTKEIIDISGSALTLVAPTSAADGIEFDSDTAAILVCVNADAGAITATVETPGTIGGVAIAEHPVTLAAGATTYVRVPSQVANDPANNNRSTVSFSAIANLTVGLMG